VLLVADSHREARMQSARFLDDCGFRVVDVTNGDEAIAAISSTPPRVILMELTLPRMPAWRLPSWLAQGIQTRDIPIIVMNPAIIMAGDFEGTVAGPIRFRPAGMLVKPFPLERMREEIRRVLRDEERRAGRRESPPVLGGGVSAAPPEWGTSEVALRTSKHDAAGSATP
jgi:CheY-like chemotaxis protein